MERIRKALEQASRERATQQGEPQTEGPVAAEDFEGLAGRDAFTPASEVAFRDTRRVSVSEEVLERNRLVAALPDHELRDAYRMLRTRVLQSMTANDWRTLAISSPATGSGKTLTSINLAISLALELSHTVMLVDLDLRRPSIHKYFEIQPELGLSDFLFHDAPVKDILFTPSIDRFVVMPGRERVFNSSEALRSPHMLSLVDELKNRYPDRLVIFDLPPLLAVDDAMAFAPYADCMLLVAENGVTGKDDLEASFQALEGRPIIGTVLNKSDNPVKGRYMY